jgi:hypothetical protein
MFLDLLDPDPDSLVRTQKDSDLCSGSVPLSSSKNRKKNLDSL